MRKAWNEATFIGYVENCTSYDRSRLAVWEPNIMLTGMNGNNLETSLSCTIVPMTPRARTHTLLGVK